MTLPDQLRDIADRIEAATALKRAALDDLAGIGHYVVAVLGASVEPGTDYAFSIPDGSSIEPIEQATPRERARGRMDETDVLPATIPASPGTAPGQGAAGAVGSPVPAFDPLGASSEAICPDCGHQAKNVAGLAIHRGRAHRKKSLITEGDPTEPNGHDFKSTSSKIGLEWFLCPHCPAKYGSKQRVDEHVARRHPPTPGLKPVGIRPSNQTFTGGIGAEKIA